MRLMKSHSLQMETPYLGNVLVFGLEKVFVHMKALRPQMKIRQDAIHSVYASMGREKVIPNGQRTSPTSKKLLENSQGDSLDRTKQ